MINCHTTTPLAAFNTPDAHFGHVHIDLVGPLPHQKAVHIFIHVSTDLLGGQKLFLLVAVLQRMWHKLFSLAEFLALGYPYYHH